MNQYYNTGGLDIKIYFFYFLKTIYYIYTHLKKRIITKNYGQHFDYTKINIVIIEPYK